MVCSWSLALLTLLELPATSGDGLDLSPPVPHAAYASGGYGGRGPATPESAQCLPTVRKEPNDCTAAQKLRRTNSPVGLPVPIRLLVATALSALLFWVHPNRWKSRRAARPARRHL
jgi:hypothetical protein